MVEEGWAMRPCESPTFKKMSPKGVMIVEAEILWQQVVELPKGAIIVEIGSWTGSSTYAMALGCKDNDVKIFAVDTFMGSPGGEQEWSKNMGSNYFETFKNNLEEFIDNGTVTPLEMSSAGALMYTPKLEPDMIFIDGSHQYEDVLFDLTYWWERLKPNGLLALHDSNGHPNFHPQVLTALQDFMKDKGLGCGHLMIGSTSFLRKKAC